jgi:hypothetical protein
MLVHDAPQHGAAEIGTAAGENFLAAWMSILSGGYEPAELPPGQGEWKDLLDETALADLSSFIDIDPLPSLTGLTKLVADTAEAPPLPNSCLAPDVLPAPATDSEPLPASAFELSIRLKATPLAQPKPHEGPKVSTFMRVPAPEEPQRPNISGGKTHDPATVFSVLAGGDERAISTPEAHETAAPRVIQQLSRTEDAEPAVASRGQAREVALETRAAEGSRVRIRFSAESGEVQVSVRANSDTVARTLREHLPELLTRLEARGFEGSWQHGNEKPSSAQLPAPLAGAGTNDARPDMGGGRQRHARNPLAVRAALSSRPAWLQQVSDILVQEENKSADISNQS